MYLMKNDIEPVNPNAINTSKIGPEGKFINYVKCKECDEIHIKNKPFEFTHDLLHCEKITEDMRLNAAANMFEHLQKHIESEMEKEFKETSEDLIAVLDSINDMIYRKKSNIRNKLRDKYPNPLLPERYSQLIKPDFSASFSFF